MGFIAPVFESGTACGGNSMCASDVCTQNVCRTEKVEDLAACDESDDCASSFCGVGSYVNNAATGE